MNYNDYFLETNIPEAEIDRQRYFIKCASEIVAHLAFGMLGGIPPAIWYTSTHHIPSVIVGA